MNGGFERAVGDGRGQYLGLDHGLMFGNGGSHAFGRVDLERDAIGDHEILSCAASWTWRMRSRAVPSCARAGVRSVSRLTTASLPRSARSGVAVVGLQGELESSPLSVGRPR